MKNLLLVLAMTLISAGAIACASHDKTDGTKTKTTQTKSTTKKTSN